MQRELMTKIDQVIIQAQVLDAPIADKTRTPVFNVTCGTAEKTFDLVAGMRSNGFCVTAAMHPIVPLHRDGIRFTITRHNQAEDIAQLVATLAEECHRLGIHSPIAPRRRSTDEDVTGVDAESGTVACAKPSQPPPAGQSDRAAGSRH
jgi:hypothetical protein